MSSIEIPTTTKDQEEKKLFFTTTDLLNKINTVLQQEQLKASPKSSDTDPLLQTQEDEPQFELQRRLPDGSTRKANNVETDYADFQAKLKQAGQVVSSLTPEDKLEWAENQRQEGNKLYSKQQYKEAMDVYLTCLVAIDKSCHDPIIGNTDNDVMNNDIIWEQQVEQQVKLPVLLNLSACTLSLGMFKKTCAFCDLALDLRIGNTSQKLYFRRGRARMGLGLYCEAKEDLIVSMDILQRQESEKADSNGVDKKEICKMKLSVEKELLRLEVLVVSAEKNREKQTRAMQRILGGGKVKTDVNLKVGSFMETSHNGINANDKSRNSTSACEERLYSTIVSQREYSTLRAPSYTNAIGAVGATHRKGGNSVFVWYIKILERSLRKILYWLGDEEAMTKKFDVANKNE